MALKLVIVGSIEAVSNIDHNDISNRNAPNQHTIESITDLRQELNIIEDDILDINNKSVIRVNLEIDLFSIENPQDGWLALVKDGYKLFAYDALTSSWILASGKGGSGGSYTLVLFSASENQTLFNLPVEYNTNSNGIEVYLNGILLTSATTDENDNPITFDFIEKARDKIEFTYGLKAGELVAIKVYGPMIRPSYTKTYTYENSILDPSKKRVKTEIITGAISKITTYTYDNQDRVTLETVVQDGITRTKTITYSNNNISSITDTGTESLIIHQLSNRIVFDITNQSTAILSHYLNRKDLHVTVWVNDQDYTKNCTVTLTNNNQITVTTISGNPITGRVVIS